jgi:hypothetical protein
MAADHQVKADGLIADKSALQSQQAIVVRLKWHRVTASLVTAIRLRIADRLRIAESALPHSDGFVAVG